MLQEKPTKKYRAHLKSYSKNKTLLKEIYEVIIKLQRQEPLDEKYRDHQLSGNKKGFRDCHIRPDVVLIYQIGNDSLYLIDIGNHNNTLESMNEDIISNQKFQSRFSNGDVINQSIEENGIANSYQILLKNTLWNLQLQKDLLVKVFKIVDNIEYKLFEGNLPEFLDYMNSDYSEQILVESILNENSRPVTVEFYRDESGCPTIEFLNSIPYKKLLDKTKRVIALLQDGKAKAGTDFKPVEDNVLELRAQFGSDYTRIFYFTTNGKAILMNGVLKKKNKADRDDISKAKKIMKKYYEDNGGNNK